MSGYYGIGSDAESFFSSYFNNGSTGSSGSVLSDYASIQNGSYKKLVSAYYAKQKELDAEDANEDTDETLRKTVSAASDADALATSAAGLMKRGGDSVFSMKETQSTDETTGKKTTTKDYDRKAINSAITDFVDKYNALVDSGSDLDSVNVLRTTLNMTKMTNVNAGVLADIGITIGDGNKLEVNEEKLSKASISDLTNVFQGSGSYGSRIAQYATQISSAAAVENAKAAGTYSNTGSYAKYLDTGKLYEGLY